MASPSFSLRRATYPRFIDLDRPFSANSISVRTNHCYTQFVQHLEGRLVTSETKLLLELQRTHARCLGCDQVRCPKPDVQLLSRTMHDCASGKARLVAAMATFHGIM